ncbi:MAG: glutathione S-transferase [Gammaproteobacteria bacterium]|nr:MAG: glutathione S-transferase [Gammaproteobacteria bacterium]
MITVHHLNNSRSQRVLWLLEELGVDYTVKHYQRDPKTQLAPASLRAVHPLGKSPVISDGDITVAESGAIVEYLIQTYGGKPWAFKPGSEQQRQYQYWLHYAEGTLMPFLVMQLVFDTIKNAPMPFIARPVARGIANEAIKAYVGPNVADNLAFVEQHVQGREYFVGDKLSGADVQMLFPLEAAVSKGAGTDYPHIAAYVQRMQQRPAYQRGLDKGGTYEYAL